MGAAKLKIPTAQIVGKEDEVYENALKLHELYEKDNAVMVVHENGPIISRDGETVRRMARAVRDLRGKMGNIY
jgi:carbamate kinase